MSSVLGDILLGWDFVWRILSAAITFIIITLLLAMIYKILPYARIICRAGHGGGVVTALLFTIGRSRIGLYLGNSSVASAYGSAGSFVVLLLWIYYSAQILLFGAEFTQVYANRFGSVIRPDKHAKFAADATALEKGADGSSEGDNLPQTRSEYKAQQKRMRSS